MMTRRGRLSGLRQRRSRFRQDHKCYSTWPPMKKPYGSANIAGEFTRYSYHVDKGTGKLVREILGR